MRRIKTCVFIAIGWCLSACEMSQIVSSSIKWEIEPSAAEFGLTGIGSEKTRNLVFHNTGTVPVGVSKVQFTSDAFSLEVFDSELVSPGETLALHVVFGPLTQGDDSADMFLWTTESDESTKIKLHGVGVATLLSIEPDVVDFGNVEVGEKATSNVTLVNTSSVDAETRIMVVGEDSSMFTSEYFSELIQLAPYERLKIPVDFRPGRLASANAVLDVQTCSECSAAQVEVFGFGVSSLLDVQPLRIQFGKVPVGARAQKQVTFFNQGSEIIAVQSLKLTPEGGPFQVDPVPSQNLSPGQTLKATITFAPTEKGQVSSTSLEVHMQAKNVMGMKIPVTGEASTPCLVAVPQAIDFGAVPLGMYSEYGVSLFNRCSETVQILQSRIHFVVGGYFRILGNTGTIDVPAGKSSKLLLQFSPQVGSIINRGEFEVDVAEMGVESSLRVTLEGTMASLGPCLFHVNPTALDFGNVPPGQKTAAGVEFKNTGSSACFIQRALIAPGSSSSFTMTERQAVWVNPGQQETFTVEFRPTAGGSWNGAMQLDVPNSSNGGVWVSLSGFSSDSCLDLKPEVLDFGQQAISCGPSQRAMRGTNICSTPIQVSSIQLAPALSNDFSVSSAPLLPILLAPSQIFIISLSYDSATVGKDVGQLRVKVDSEAERNIGVFGEYLSTNRITDTFLQGTPAPVDVLWVVDNSGSMTEEQVYLASNFASFISEAKAGGVDFHLGVTTTGIQPAPSSWAPCPGGAEGGEAGRLFPVDGSFPRVVTSSTPNPETVFANNVKVGWCHWDEQGLEAAYRAVSQPLIDQLDDIRTPIPADGNAGFLRQDAKLVVVVVSDEDDASPRELSFYEKYFRTLKGNDVRQFQFSAIVAPENLSECPTAGSSGSRYIELASRNGGTVENICSTDWSKSLKLLSKQLFGPQRVFPLSRHPQLPVSIDVSVDGAALSSGWFYQAGSNAVVFTTFESPPPGSLVQISYLMACEP